jgi:hypothetical protein
MSGMCGSTSSQNHDGLLSPRHQHRPAGPATMWVAHRWHLITPLALHWRRPRCTNLPVYPNTNVHLVKPVRWPRTALQLSHTIPSPYNTGSERPLVLRRLFTSKLTSLMPGRANLVALFSLPRTPFLNAEVRTPVWPVPCTEVIPTPPMRSWALGSAWAFFPKEERTSALAATADRLHISSS